MMEGFGEWRFETTDEGRVRIACNGGDCERGMTEVAPSDTDALATLRQALGYAPDRAMCGGIVACAQAARKMIAEFERRRDPARGVKICA